MDKFEQTIDKFVINTQERLLAVVRTSIQATVEEAQTSKMPVDTGFLRWSGVATLNSLPMGDSSGRRRRSGENGVLPEYSDGKRGGILSKTLAELKIGDTFYWGWTARYAKYQEMRRGFLETALMNFKSHVDRAVSEFKK